MYLLKKAIKRFAKPIHFYRHPYQAIVLIMAEMVIMAKMAIIAILDIIAIIAIVAIITKINIIAGYACLWKRLDYRKAVQHFKTL